MFPLDMPAPYTPLLSISALIMSRVVITKDDCHPETIGSCVPLQQRFLSAHFPSGCELPNEEGRMSITFPLGYVMGNVIVRRRSFFKHEMGR